MTIEIGFRKDGLVTARCAPDGLVSPREIAAWLAARAASRCRSFGKPPAVQNRAAAASADEPLWVVDAAECAVMRSSDPQAFARIIERYQGELARYLSRYTRCRATLEDLAQATFVEAFRGRHSYRGDAPLMHWLRVIATRVGYRHWRSAARDRRDRRDRGARGRRRAESG